MTSLPEFIFALAIILATPGPTNALLFTSASGIGVLRTLPLMLGELCGYGISVTLLMTVGGAVISVVPVLGQVFRVLLACYLLLLAWRLWHTDRAVMASGARTVTVGRVFVTTLLNPKSAIFAFGIFPPLATFGAAVPYAVAFAATVATAALGWISLGAVIGGNGQGRGSQYVPRAAALLIGYIASAIAGSVVGATL
jgi:threonine/homoserine/homoserine lactone efflux protein